MDTFELAYEICQRKHDKVFGRCKEFEIQRLDQDEIDELAVPSNLPTYQDGLMLSISFWQQLRNVTNTDLPLHVQIRRICWSKEKALLQMLGGMM
jgi:hypothetical protein